MIRPICLILLTLLMMPVIAASFCASMIVEAAYLGWTQAHKSVDWMCGVRKRRRA